MRAILALAILLALPTASASGHLLNVGIGSTTIQYGVNPFGGSGDALDVGVANEQCSDEADVVDVGVLNAEGRSACAPWDRCEHTQGTDPLAAVIAGSLLEPSGEPTPANCSDDGDTLDVGILNAEGGDAPSCKEPECEEPYAGDADDAADLGIANCEQGDERDAIDVGALNAEWQDGGDTFDLGVVNTETSDSGDLNGLEVGGGVGASVDCRLVRVDLPLGPTGRLLP